MIQLLATNPQNDKKNMGIREFSAMKMEYEKAKTERERKKSTMYNRRDCKGGGEGSDGNKDTRITPLRTRSTQVEVQILPSFVGAWREFALFERGREARAEGTGE